MFFFESWWRVHEVWVPTSWKKVAATILLGSYPRVFFWSSWYPSQFDSPLVISHQEQFLGALWWWVFMSNFSKWMGVLVPQRKTPPKLTWKLENAWKCCWFPTKNALSQQSHFQLFKGCHFPAVEVPVTRVAAQQPLTNQGPLILLPGIIQIAASWTAKNTNSAQTDFSQGYDYYKHLPLALQFERRDDLPLARNLPPLIGLEHDMHKLKKLGGMINFPQKLDSFRRWSFFATQPFLPWPSNKCQMDGS